MGIEPPASNHFMGLSRLEINCFRNLQSVSVDLAPRLNGLNGDNGSGKTSFLEALYILGKGASFRTKDLKQALQYGAQQFFIYGQLEPLNVSIGVEYQPQETCFRISGQGVRSRLELMSHLPLIFISPESHALISDGPQQRRRFLDWGVFHLEPKFLPAWLHYQRTLKQRNAALGTISVETVWDRALISAANEITKLRHDYLEMLSPYVDRYIKCLVDMDEVTLVYACGWRQQQDYAEILRASLPQDREQGFTRHGPHRADLILKIGNRPVRESISRGQQKLLVIALLLAQVALLNKVTFVRPVILIDDLVAELDVYHRQRLLAVLFELNAQVIFTLTEQRSLPKNPEFPIDWFHVEHGRIMPR